MLNIPFKFAKNGQKIVVIFNKFQEIVNFDIEAKKALKIVVEKNGISLYDEQYFAKYQIKSGSFQVALNGLIKKDVIDKNGSIYYIYDPLFEYWIKQD